LLALLTRVKDYFEVVSFVVYGSVARNEARKESDVDILLVLEDLADRYTAFKLFERSEHEVEPLIRRAEEDGYRIFFSPIIKSREEASRISPLYLDLVEDAVILYDNGDFFKTILEKLKLRLADLKAKRVWVGKKWYWDLKSDYKFGERIEIE
jgi:predicted nucleotidyltransferase